MKIYDKYSNTELLNQYNIPVFHCLEDIANTIGLSSKIIYLFSMHNYRYYRKFNILKKNKQKREICAPIFQLKLVQKWLLINIFSKLLVSSSAMAFKKRVNGIKENALMHLGNLYILQIDLKDFFNSITQEQVFKLLRKKGYNASASAIITGLCTYNDFLPQGGITSPTISNLICNRLDKRLLGLCNKRDITYSRYADDMTFSSNDKTALKKIKQIVASIIQQEGFTINETKTRFLSPKSRKTITGLNINSNDVKADKNLKKQVRAMIYKSIMSKDYSKNNKIRGIVSYINSIEKDYKTKICNYINSIEDRLIFNEDAKEIINEYNQNKIFKETKTFKHF